MKKSLLTAAIVVVYALAACAVQTWQDRRASGGTGKGWLALVAISLIALLVLLLLVFIDPSFACERRHIVHRHHVTSCACRPAARGVYFRFLP